MPIPLAAFGSLVGPDFLIILAIGVAMSAFWLWMLIDCIRNQTLRDTDRTVWLLVILLTHILGAVLYCFMARAGRSRPGV